LKVSEVGIKLIQDFEGCSLVPYADIVGKMTIGYGHLIRPEDRFNPPLTHGQAVALLCDDLEKFESWVLGAVTVDINQNQFDALVSFTFNLGPGALQKSTLLRKLNGGDYSGAADEFLKWCKAGGKEVAGLLRRRKAERELFLTKVKETA
jgi:lysozyme